MSLLIISILYYVHKHIRSQIFKNKDKSRLNDYFLIVFLSNTFLAIWVLIPEKNYSNLDLNYVPTIPIIALILLSYIVMYQNFITAKSNIKTVKVDQNGKD